MDISPDMLKSLAEYEEYLQSQYAESKAREARDKRIKRVEAELASIFAGVDLL